MRKNVLVFGILFFAIMFFVSSTARSADWRFPLGLSYISGFGDISDIHEDNLKAEYGGVTKSSDPMPVALTFHPYIQFDNGCGAGVGIGPMMLIIGDTDFFNLPIKLDFRYTIIPRANISPYVRVGGSYHLASGDYVEGSSPGVFGCVGVEFLRKKVVSIGLEISYDTAEIELEKMYGYSWSASPSTIEKIEPCGLMISIFAVF